MRHRPFVWITTAYALGVLGGSVLPASFVVLCVLTVFALALVPVFARGRTAASVCVLAVLFFLGAAAYQHRQVLPRDHVSRVARYYRKDPVRVEGLIVSAAEQRAFFRSVKTVFVLEVRRFKTRWGWKEKSGRVLVNIFRRADLHYGDYLRLEGKMHRPFEFSEDGRLSYRDYLERKGIRHVLSVKKKGMAEVLASGGGNGLMALSLKVKERLGAVLSRHLTENEAGIMKAVILGDRQDIPGHIRELCEKASVSHVFAISGLHVGVVAFIVLLFLRMLPVPRKAQYLLACVLLVFYAFLTGGRPSVVRATIMASVFFAGFIVERDGDSVNTLFFAAFLILLGNPANLFDVGVRLSFTSVFFIIALYPVFARLLLRPRRDAPSPFLLACAHALCVSLAAWLGVAGWLAYYFRIVSPVAVLANLAVVPLTAVVVILGMGLLAFGLVLPAAAFVFAQCLGFVLNVMAGLVFLFVRIPGAYFYLDEVSLWLIVLYYVLLLSGLWVGLRLTGGRTVMKKVV